MSARLARRVAVFLPISLSGLLAGHWVNYLLLERDVAHRAARLAGTGHGYMRGAIPATAALAALTATAVVWAGFARGRGGGRRLGPGPSFTRTAVPLAWGQATGFVVLEIVERLAAGAGLKDAIGPLVLLGVLVQIAGAALTAAVIVGLDRAGETAARLLGLREPPLRAPVSAGAPIVPSLPSSNPRRAAFGVRGPPRRSSLQRSYA